MPVDPESFARRVSELVNALQVAVPLSQALKTTLEQSARDAADLHTQLERATTAAGVPPPTDEGGDRS
jgi:hypothetical protein